MAHSTKGTPILVQAANGYTMSFPSVRSCATFLGEATKDMTGVDIFISEDMIKQWLKFDKPYPIPFEHFMGWKLWKCESDEAQRTALLKLCGVSILNDSSTPQPINSTTIQPNNHSTLQPSNHSTLQPSNHSTLQLYNSSTTDYPQSTDNLPVDYRKITGNLPVDNSIVHTEDDEFNSILQASSRQQVEDEFDRIFNADD